MAGPTCGVMLADLGADVIKVEKLPGGDDSRGYREPRVNGVSAPFLMMNRGKRGIALDLKRPEGRAILLRMVRTADVLVENFRRDTMDEARPLLRRARRGEPGARLLRGDRVRPRRPRRRQGRLRPRRAGIRGPDGDHGRAGPAARQDRQSGVRHQRRHPRRAGHRRRVRASAEDRARPARRHVAVRGRAAADVLARVELLRDRASRRGRSAPRTS